MAVCPEDQASQEISCISVSAPRSKRRRHSTLLHVMALSTIDKEVAGLYCPPQQVTQVNNTAYAPRPFPARRCRFQVYPCAPSICVSA